MSGKTKQFTPAVKARKKREEASISELLTLASRKRKLADQELGMLAPLFALSNLGMDVNYELTGDKMSVKAQFSGLRGKDYDLKTEMGEVTRVLYGRYNGHMAEVEFELQESDPKEARKFKADGELNYWRKDLAKISLEKMAKTWPDMAPLVLWLAKNGEAA